MSHFSCLNELIFLGSSSFSFLIDCFTGSVFCQVHWPCLCVEGQGGRGWVSIQLSPTFEDLPTMEFIILTQQLLSFSRKALYVSDETLKKKKKKSRFPRTFCFQGVTYIILCDLFLMELDGVFDRLSEDNLRIASLNVP